MEKRRYKPITAWGYVFYTILYAIPVIGWLFLIIFSFSSNPNRRHFARSFWCWLFLAVLIIILWAAGVFSHAKTYLNDALNVTTEIVQNAAQMVENAALMVEKEINPQSNVTRQPAASARPTAAPTAKVYSNTVTPEFKKAMDDYAEFFSQYCAFMKKYDSSSASIAMAADYVKMLNKYERSMEALENIDEDQLSEADLRYYLETMNKIEKMLLDAAL